MTIQKIKGMYLSSKGRLSRKEFIKLWSCLILLQFVKHVMILDIFSSLLNMNSSNFRYAVYINEIIAIIFLIPTFYLFIRRAHDLNKSGWLVLLIFAPFIDVLFLLYLCLFKGTDGPNKFGDDPLQITFTKI